MSRFFVTIIMAFAFLLGSTVSEARAWRAETYAKAKKPCAKKDVETLHCGKCGKDAKKHRCDKCKKAGKKDCECGKKKSDVEQLNCGKCPKSKDCKGCKGCKDCKHKDCKHKDCKHKDCKSCPHKKTCGCKKKK